MEKIIYGITKVVNIKTGAKYDIFIGRPSKRGNPFRIGRDGTREDVLLKYENYLLYNPKLMSEIEELHGKVLGCLCKPLPCHGDVLIEILEK